MSANPYIPPYCFPAGVLSIIIHRSRLIALAADRTKHGIRFILVYRKSIRLSNLPFICVSIQAWPFTSARPHLIQMRILTSCQWGTLFFLRPPLTLRLFPAIYPSTCGGGGFFCFSAKHASISIINKIVKKATTNCIFCS